MNDFISPIMLASSLDAVSLILAMLALVLSLILYASASFFAFSSDFLFSAAFFSASFLLLAILSHLLSITPSVMGTPQQDIYSLSTDSISPDAPGLSDAILVIKSMYSRAASILISEY